MMQNNTQDLEINQNLSSEHLKKDEFDTEQQLYLLLILSEFVDPKNIRKKRKTNPFKILNAIYLFTKHAKIKNFKEVFPSYDLLAKMAHCSRKEVAELISSGELDIFCDIQKEYFKTNRYFLKPWVFKWFEVLYREGFMKWLHEDFKKWRHVFQKRMKKLIMPLIEKGFNIWKISIELLNRLSTKRKLKGDTVNRLKGDTIKTNSEMKTYVFKTNIVKPPDKPIFDEIDLIFTEHKGLCMVLKDRFNMKIADIYHFIRKNSVCHLRCAVSLLEKRYSTGWRANSPVKALQSILNKRSPQKRAA
jgi:hypothetical protein